MPKFKTVRFGELDYNQNDVVVLSNGLVGMPHLHNWLLMDMGEDHAMKWFQSLDRGDFGFPVTQPFFFLEDYDIELDPESLAGIGNQSEDDIAIMIITTVHTGGDKVTGNMMAPLVIDVASHQGIQLTLDGDYNMRQELNYFKFGLAVNGSAVENGSASDLQEAAAAGCTDQGMSSGAVVEETLREPALT